MVDTCQEKITIPTSFLHLLKLKERGHHLTTVYQSDIRGLVTA